jgi:hypothetical protein
MADTASKRRPRLFANPLRRLQPSWRQALRAPAVSGLIALLLVQLVAALVLAAQDWQRRVPDAPLLTVAPERVRAIEIVSDAQTLRLERAGAGWVLPGLDGFPADAGKVEQLLTAITELPRSLPVAASAESRQRLQVADDNAETRIRLLAAEGVLAELLTGDSPGFRRLYGRLAGEEEVYDLPLPGFLVASDSDDWVPRDRLRLAADAITRISSDDWTLVRTEDGAWELEDDQRPVDQAEAERLVRRIANLSYQGVATRADAAATEAEAPSDGASDDSNDGSRQREPRLSLMVGLDDGTTVRRLVYLDGDDGYRLRTGRDGPVYRLSEYDLDGLLDIGADALVAPPEPEAATGGTAVSDRIGAAPTDADSTATAPAADAAPSSAAPSTPDAGAAVDGATAPEAAPAPAPAAPRDAAAPGTGPAASSSMAAPTPAATAAGQPPATTADAPAAPTAERGDAAAGAGAGDAGGATAAEDEQARASAASAADTADADAGGADNGDAGNAAASGDGAADDATAARDTRQESEPARPQAPAQRWPYQRYAPPQPPRWPPQGPPRQQAPPQSPPPGWR